MFYFIKQIFIFGPCGAKNKNFEPAELALGPDGAQKFFCKQKNFKLAALAQLSMQASKVVAAKAARVKTKDKYPWFLLSRAC